MYSKCLLVIYNIFKTWLKIDFIKDNQLCKVDI